MNISRHLLRMASREISKLSNRLGSFKAELSGDQETLEVTTENGTDRFPVVWLRDNCLCDKCYHEESSSRTINWSDFNVDVRVKTIQNDQNKVLIKWDDDHKSEYRLEWLENRSFKESSQNKFLNEICRPPKKLWGKDLFFHSLRKHEYNEVINDNKTMCNWLEDLILYGVVLIKNCPPDKDVNKNLTEKIAYLKPTHYGKTHEIRAKPGTQNVAYLSSLLQLHTDLPYYNYAPGATLLHYIEQTKTEGGENLLVDVFYVAEKLRRENKKVFDILSTTRIDWSDIGEEDGVKFYKIIREPMISLDPDGKITMVRHSIPQRDTHFTTPLENVKPWYKAFRIFVDEINKEAAQFKLDEGDLLGFDNIRLVHGRLKYEDTANNRRLLVGSYVDWDEIYSKWRVLKYELGHFKKM